MPLVWAATTAPPGGNPAATAPSNTTDAEWAAIREMLKSCDPSWSFLYPYEGPFPCRADFRNPNEAWGTGDKLLFLLGYAGFWACVCCLVHLWPSLSAALRPLAAKGCQGYTALDLEGPQTVEATAGPTPPYPSEKRVVDLFEEQVRIAPNAVALVVPRSAEGPRREVTYAELDAAAEELCAALLLQGLSVGSVAALVLHRSVAQVVAIYGVLKSGAAFLPIDADAPPERMEFLVGESGARVVVGAAAGDGAAERAAAAAGCPAYVAVPSDGSRGRLSMRSLPPRSLRGPVTCAAGGLTTRCRPSEDDMALLIYTSGTTGQPKGIVYDHRFLMHGVHFFGWQCEMGSDSVALLKSPYIWAIVEYELFPALTRGGRLVVASADGHRSPEYLAGAVHAERVSTLVLTPQVLDLVLDIHEARGRDRPLASVRHVVAVGDALASSVANRAVRVLRDAQLHNFYGASESSCAVYTVPREGVDLGAFPARVPAGTPQPHVSVYVMRLAAEQPGGGPETPLERAPAGEPGEICFGGVLAARYWGHAELTAQRWVRTAQHGVLYRTGDLGRWRAGQLEVLGRTDRQVKVRGVRVEPEEVEAVLRQYALPAAPACAEAAAAEAEAAAADLEEGGGGSAPAGCAAAERAALREVAVVASQEPAELVAFVSARDGVAGEVTAEALRAHCRAKLAPPYVPKFYVVLPELPKLPNGKPNLAQLRDLATQHAAEEGEVVVDSLGQMRRLSRWAVLENAVIHRCYAYWMVGVLADHYMRCSMDFFNGGQAPFCTVLSRTNVKPWTEILVRSVGNDQDMFGFIMLGAYQDGRPAQLGAPPRVKLGLKDLFAFVVYMMMALPLPQLVYFLTNGWAWPSYWGGVAAPTGVWNWDYMRHNGAASGHRWYLLMVVETRVFMQVCEKLHCPGWLQVIVFALPILGYGGESALDFCEDAEDTPSYVLYLLSWAFRNYGSGCPLYLRWYQVYGTFYVFCFHYLRPLVDWFQRKVPPRLRTSTWGAVAASTSMMMGMMMALFHYPNQLMELGRNTKWACLEVAVDILQPALLSIGMAFLPVDLSWWGNTTLGSYVFHYYFMDQLGQFGWFICDAVAWDPTGLLAFVLIMGMCVLFTTVVGPAGHSLLLSPTLLYSRVRRSATGKPHQATATGLTGAKA